MKNIYLILILCLTFVGCKKQESGVVAVPAQPATRDCYKVQTLNDYGKVIEDAYDCMIYEGTFGNDFQSAYDNLQSSINSWKERLYDEYKNSEYWDANRLEVRKVQCAVRNTPDDTLEYYSVDFYMYNNSYKDYITVYGFRIIDSKGNAYTREPGDD